MHGSFGNLEKKSKGKAWLVDGSRSKKKFIENELMSGSMND